MNQQLNEEKTAKPKQPRQKAAARKEGTPSKAVVQQPGSRRIAVIRIRGEVNLRTPIKDTLSIIGLKRKHHCIVFDENPSMLGMVEKIKDYVTYGELDDATFAELVQKRQEKDSEGKPKKAFRLHPPRGGYERKGTKKAFAQKGALGYRGAKINDLVRKML
jgi:large subunit ribosomal protein L30